MQHLLLLAKPKNAKEAVVKTLSQNWPLSLKQIYNNSTKLFGLNVSYQAMHKAVKELKEEGIVTGIGKEYSLNKEWIKNTKKAIDEISSKYEKGFGEEQIYSEKEIHLKFDTFVEFARFMIHEFFINFPNPENKPALCMYRHVYAPFGVSEKDHESIKAFLKHEHYAICKNNTFLDNWCTAYLTKMGKKCLNGADYSANGDVFIQGDYVMQAFFPPSFIKEFDKIYQETKSVESIEVKKYFEKIVTQKQNIHVLITKNAELADLFRKEVLSYFKKK